MTSIWPFTIAMLNIWGVVYGIKIVIYIIDIIVKALND